MGAFLLLASSIIVVGFLYGAEVYRTFANTSYEVEKYKESEKVLSKIDEINDLANVDSYIGNVNQNRLDSMKLIRNKPFSMLISDTKGVKGILINKYAEASKILLNNYPNANDDYFTCERLTETKLITQDECALVKDQEFSFFNLKDGSIVYDVGDEQAARIQEIQKNRKTNLDIQYSSENNVTTLGRNVTLNSKVFTKEISALADKELKIEKLIEQNRYDIASALMADIEKSGIKSEKLAELRNTLVIKKLVQEGQIVLDAGEIEAKMINQDISILPAAIKQSIVQTVSLTTENGIKKYVQNEDSKILLQKINQDIQDKSEDYENLTQVQRSKFSEIVNKL